MHTSWMIAMHVIVTIQLKVGEQMKHDWYDNEMNDWHLVSCEKRTFQNYPGLGVIEKEEKWRKSTTYKTIQCSS